VISGIKKAFFLGLGAFSVTKERAEKFFDEMVKKGEMTREEANELFNALIERGKEEREHIQKIVKTEVEKFKMSTKFVSKEEFYELSERVAKLEKMLYKENNE